MFELKTLSPEAVPRALAKAERYRLLSSHSGARHSINEHRKIYEHALGRNSQAAVEALRKHLSMTVETLEPLVKPAPIENERRVQPVNAAVVGAGGRTAQ